MTTVTAPRVPMDQRVRARRVAVQRAAGRRRLRRVLLVAGSLTALLVAVAIAYSPLLAVHTVVVDGAGTEQADVARAAHVVGKPIVLVSAITACWISSGVAPAASARRAWLCTAPSERIAAAAASCTRCRVFSGRGPASAAA